MHFAVMVAVPADTNPNDLEDVVARILAPFDENVEHDCPKTEANDWEDDCGVCDRSWWDWWQIGGRWAPARNRATQAQALSRLGRGRWLPAKVVAGDVVMTRGEATDDYAVQMVAKGDGVDWVIVDCHV